MRTPAPEGRQLTSWTLTDLEAALALLESADSVDMWPVTSDHGAHAITFAQRLAQRVYDGGFRHTALNTLQDWNTRCRPPWSEAQLSGFLDHADRVARAEQRQVRENSPAAVRFRERLAAEQREREARTARAAKIKELAERLGIGLRQARSIAAEGTSDARASKISAEIFGIDESAFFRPIAKLGRPIDWERRFLALNIPGGSFEDFRREQPTADSGWKDYLRWRLELLGKLIGADEFDFG